MSPEQARAGAVDFRSDVYALGIVIFEIFSGRVPFKGASLADTILKQLDEPPPLDAPVAAAIPAPLKAVLARALEKDPQARFQSATEMRVALELAREASYAEAEAGFAAEVSDEAAPTIAWTEAPTVDRSVVGSPTRLESPPTRIESPPTRLEAPPTRLETPPRLSPPLRARRRRVGRRWITAGLLTATVAGVGAAVLLLRTAPAEPPVAATAPTPAPEAAATPGPSPSLTPPAPEAARATATPSPPARAGTPARGHAVAPPQPTPAPPPRPPVPQPPADEAPATPVAAVASEPPTPPPTPTPVPSKPAPVDPDAPILLPATAVQPVWLPSNPPPVYPAAAAGSGAAAVVTLKLVVSRSGEVSSVEVLAGDEPFATAAVTVARSWRYSPALVDGQPHSAYLTVRIPFRPPAARRR